VSQHAREALVQQLQNNMAVTVESTTQRVNQNPQPAGLKQVQHYARSAGVRGADDTAATDGDAVTDGER